MASYINIGNDGFKSAIKKNYVDKSGLIGMINDTLFGENRFTRVSRCRRFGKSMAAKMLPLLPSTRLRTATILRL